jgi:sulfate adenylyltransferase
VHGLTVFFTGLSGAGKTTLATALCERIPAIDARVVRLLDGDALRQRLSAELGFSKAHRDMQVGRIGYIAFEITSCGAIAVCAAIAPYDDARKRVRAEIEQVGRFVLVHVATPLEVCERRDAKGLYARARSGAIENFTGISDPYEAPQDAEIELDTTDTTVEETTERLAAFLVSGGYLGTRAR